MKITKLGVIFDHKIQSGGGYQQSLNAALIAKELNNQLVEVIFYTTIKKNIEILKTYEINAKFIELSFFSKLRVYFYRKIKNRYLFNFFRFFEKNNPRENFFIKDKIDIIYFLSPSTWPIDLERTNYITTLWDLCHQDNLEFPEVRFCREFEKREKNYRLILARALAVLVDSEFTKVNLTGRFGIQEDRVYITPFRAAVKTREKLNYKSVCQIDIKKKYNLNFPYIFYPAQFWAHKNHIYILKGLIDLKKDFEIQVGAIFSGADRGNLNFIKEFVAKEGLEDRVRFIGFVSNDEIVKLYSQSIALVMPTYFGPTNLPPVEAFEIGVPVLYSDKQGLRDQVGDAALLMDLKDSKTMATHLKNLIQNNKLRNKLIEEGKKRLKLFDSIDQVSILKTIINNFIHKRSCWK
jgi:glycosyltransferase involved in cell wall biosynthesis